MSDESDDYYDNSAERHAEYERQEREAKAAFYAAVDHLVTQTHGNLYAIGDGRGGWCLEVIARALYERHVPDWIAERDYAEAEAAEMFAPPKGLTSLHRHLHRLGERDGWYCRYCRCDVGCPCLPDVTPAVSDHVFPKSRGGENDDSNRALACRKCNQAKLDRTPEEWGGP